GARTELLAAVSVRVIADDEIPRYQVDLFPVFVDERRGRIGARLEAEVTRPEPGLVLFVERPGKNLLFDARGITRRPFPALVEIDRVKLLVFLMNRHRFSSFTGAPPRTPARSLAGPRRPLRSLAGALCAPIQSANSNERAR